MSNESLSAFTGGSAGSGVSEPSVEGESEYDAQDGETGGFNRAEKSTGSDEYGTPRTLVRQLKTAIGGLFDLDAASGAEPTPIAATRYTGPDGEASGGFAEMFDPDGFDAEALDPRTVTGAIPTDGLSQPWFGRTFINPPYSNGAIVAWLEKAVHSVQDGDAEMVVGVIPAGTSTKGWWHEYVVEADYWCFTEGRLKYEAPGADSAGFPSAIVVWTADDVEVPDDLLAVLERRGQVLAEADDTPDVSGEQAGFGDLFGGAESSGAAALEMPFVGGEAPIHGTQAGDVFRLSLDTFGPDATGALRDGAEVRVLDATPKPDGDDPEYVDVLAVTDDHDADRDEMYVSLSYPVENPSRVRATLLESPDAVSGQRQVLPLAGIEQVEANGGPATLNHVQ
jgi:hypothetical protein